MQEEWNTLIFRLSIHGTLFSLKFYLYTIKCSHFNSVIQYFEINLHSPFELNNSVGFLSFFFFFSEFIQLS